MEERKENDCEDGDDGMKNSVLQKERKTVCVDEGELSMTWRRTRDKKDDDRMRTGLRKV